MSAAAVFVDFGIVGFVDVDGGDFGAELFEDFFCDDAGGAVGTVEADVERVEVNDADVVAEMFKISSEGFVVEVLAKAG